MKTILINFLPVATLLSSVLSITSKNPVISVIFLISTFVSAAGYLIFIGINFVGLSYIIVYVGAIAVLFLFVIMMINIKLTDILETGSQYTKNLPLAISIGSLFIFILFSLIPYNFNNVPSISILLDYFSYLNNILSLGDSNNIVSFDLVGYAQKNNIFFINTTNNHVLSSHLSTSSDILLNDFQQIESLGYSLYTYGAVLLITLSVILLLAMYATIIISSPSNINKLYYKNLNMKPSDFSNTNPNLNPTYQRQGNASVATINSNNSNKKLVVSKIILAFKNSFKYLKKGWTMPTYPKHIEKLNNTIYLKIFRVIGSLCFGITVFSRRYIIDISIIIILFDWIRFIAILFMLYRIILAFYSLKQMIYYIRTGKLLVRNSPLNIPFTFYSLLSNVTKNSTNLIIGTGFVYGLGYELDEILDANGYEKYFIPGLVKMINSAGLDPLVKQTFEKVGIKKKSEIIQALENTKAETTESSKDFFDIKTINNISLSNRKLIEEKFGVSYDSLNKMSEIINSKNKEVKISITAEIMRDIEKNDPFNTRKDK